MQLASSPAFYEPPLAAMPQLAENSRQGFETWKTAWNPGQNVCNSTAAIGMRAGLLLAGVRKTYRARYYNPTTGRFLSEDPSGIAGGINLYAYARNNPVSFRDPSGLKPHDPNNPGTGGNDGNGGNGNKPDPLATNLADGLGLAAALADNTPLGIVSSILGLANDPSLDNALTTADTTVVSLACPELGPALAFGAVASDGADFSVNQVLAPVLNAAPSQTINADGVTIPNPALADYGQY